MTALAHKLAAAIARAGPLGVADFMQACLQDPEHGYYRRRQAIGAEGDFITAPEISQVFGELLGLWSAVVWQQMGSPGELRLIEIGPGRGTLMADALRAVSAVPQMLAALRVHLIEPSPRLAAIQRLTLAAAPVPIAWSQEWVAPGGPAIVIANELLDAFPVRQLVRRGGEWRERRVGIAGETGLTFVAGETAAPPAGIGPAPDGAIVETRDWSPDSEPLALLARLAGDAPLVALFMDYGHLGPIVGETLQAVRGHAYESPLAHPGEADLSAYVDFGAFLAAARSRGLQVHGPVPQASFLGCLGVAERASRLMRGAPASAANAVETGVARLIDPNGMGSRFKAVALASPGSPVPPGFE